MSQNENNRKDPNEKWPKKDDHSSTGSEHHSSDPTQNKSQNQSQNYKNEK